MSLPNKACNILRGRISFISVNATAVNPVTMGIRALHSSGYGSPAPAGKPTSLTMSLFIFRPLREKILPFLRLDGSPQKLEGTHEVGKPPLPGSAPDSSKGTPTDPDAPISGIRFLGFMVLRPCSPHTLDAAVSDSPMLAAGRLPPFPGGPSDPAGFL
jgi:hypothetical protein